MQVPFHSGEIQIRVATMRELDGILAVQGSAPGSAQWPRSVYAEILQTSAQSTSVRGRVVFCALHGDLLVGFAVAAMLQMVEATECELENMAVDPVWHHRGLGRRLVESVLAWCGERNASLVNLEVRASNAAAMELYQKMGFQPEGRRFQYYTQPVEDAVLMTWTPPKGPLQGHSKDC